MNFHYYPFILTPIFLKYNEEIKIYTLFLISINEGTLLISEEKINWRFKTFEYTDGFILIDHIMNIHMLNFELIKFFK